MEFSGMVKTRAVVARARAMMTQNHAACLVRR